MISMLLYQTLAFTKHGKILKSHTNIINLKYQPQHGMKSLNFWWVIFLIRYSRLFWIYIEKHETITDNPSIKIYVNIIRNRITFKVKTGYYLERLTPELMKLLGSTKSKMIKDENGENVPHLKITEVVLINYNIVNDDYQLDLIVLYTFVPNKSFGQLLNILPKSAIFLKTFNSKFS